MDTIIQNIDWKFIGNVLFAIMGGLSINFMRYVDANKKSSEHQKLTKTRIYKIQFVITALMGGLITAAYGGSGVILTPILSIQIGASAPLIIKSLASATPTLIPNTNA